MSLPVRSVLLAMALAACAEPEPRPPAPPPAEDAPTASALAAARSGLPAPFAEGEYEAGRRVFAQCRTCHTLTRAGPHRVGPNLHGLFGRPAGAAPGFAYSNALQAAPFAWDAQRLDAWLEDPRATLPGNRMAYAGLRDAQDRRDVIFYLAVGTAP